MSREVTVKLKDVLNKDTLRTVGGAVRNKTGLLIAIIVVLAIILAPAPAPFDFNGTTIELSHHAQLMIALLAGVVIIFLTEALPLGALVGIVYVWLVFFGIFNKETAASYLSHDAVWFLVGALMIATVLTKYNLHKYVLFYIMKAVGTTTFRMVFGIVAFCALCAAFIGEHTVAALMFPIAIAIVQSKGGYEKVPKTAKLLMLAIAAGCAVGGLGTPSGGGRNVIMIGYLNDLFNVNVSYGGWLVMALPIVLIMIPVVVLVLYSVFKPEVKDISEISGKIKEEMSMAPFTVKHWAVIGIFLLVLGLWITQHDLGIGAIAMFGVLLFLLLGLAEWKDYQKINWGIPMLYFGAVGLGKALNETGAALWLGTKILYFAQDILHINSEFGLIAISSVLMSMMTQTMGDGPCVATMAPMLLQSAKLAGIKMVKYGMAVAISSAFAFALVLGNPANAIVYGSGYLTAKDYRRAGIILVIIALIVLLVISQFWWGILGVSASGFH